MGHRSRKKAVLELRTFYELDDQIESESATQQVGRKLVASNMGMVMYTRLD